MDINAQARVIALRFAQYMRTRDQEALASAIAGADESADLVCLTALTEFQFSDLECQYANFVEDGNLEPESSVAYLKAWPQSDSAVDRRAETQSERVAFDSQLGTLNEQLREQLRIARANVAGLGPVKKVRLLPRAIEVSCHAD